METTRGYGVRGLFVIGAALVVSATARDAGADLPHVRVVLSFNGTQFSGTAQSVTEATTSVNGSLQYRVNLAAVTSDGKRLQCSIAVASAAAAEVYRNEILGDHTAGVTCAVSHAVTTDPTAGTFVFLNMNSPSAGDSLTIESR